MNIREEIKILWEGPFKIDDILENNIEVPYEVRADDIGLYQVYGTHPLYGSRVLLYIGRTKDAKGFQSRLKGRWVIEDGSDSENIEIYLGTIFSDSKELLRTDIENLELIEKSEVLLINAMKPAYNSSNIQSANQDFIHQNFILHNVGNYRDIYPVLDSKYFWQAYYNFAIVNELAQDLDKKIDDTDTYYGFIVREGKKENDTFQIWLCVDYEIWEKKKIPLVIQIETESEKIQRELENKELKRDPYVDGSIVFYEKWSGSSIEKLKNRVDEIYNDLCS